MQLLKHVVMCRLIMTYDELFLFLFSFSCFPVRPFIRLFVCLFVSCLALSRTAGKDSLPHLFRLHLGVFKKLLGEVGIGSTSSATV